MASNYIFNGIHSSAQNAWIDVVACNCQNIHAARCMADRLRMLQAWTESIPGISEEVVFKTLIEIESEHYQ